MQENLQAARAPAGPPVRSLRCSQNVIAGADGVSETPPTHLPHLLGLLTPVNTVCNNDNGQLNTVTRSPSSTNCCKGQTGSATHVV